MLPDDAQVIYVNPRDFIRDAELLRNYKVLQRKAASLETVRGSHRHCLTRVLAHVCDAVAMMEKEGHSSGRNTPVNRLKLARRGIEKELSTPTRRPDMTDESIDFGPPVHAGTVAYMRAETDARIARLEKENKTLREENKQLIHQLETARRYGLMSHD